MKTHHEQALQFALDGDWDRAHQMVQNASDRLSCLIHAYLHRVEGDTSNARYWYRRAGESEPGNTIDEESQRLAALVAAERD